MRKLFENKKDPHAALLFDYMQNVDFNSSFFLIPMCWMLFRCSHVIIRGLSEASIVPKVQTNRRHWRRSQTSSSRSVLRWMSTQESDTRSKPVKISFLSSQHTPAPSWDRRIQCYLTVAGFIRKELVGTMCCQNTSEIKCVYTCSAWPHWKAD